MVIQTRWRHFSHTKGLISALRDILRHFNASRHFTIFFKWRHISVTGSPLSCGMRKTCSSVLNYSFLAFLNLQKYWKRTKIGQKVMVSPFPVNLVSCKYKKKCCRLRSNTPGLNRKTYKFINKFCRLLVYIYTHQWNVCHPPTLIFSSIIWVFNSLQRIKLTHLLFYPQRSQLPAVSSRSNMMWFALFVAFSCFVEKSEMVAPTFKTGK